MLTVFFLIILCLSLPVALIVLSDRRLGVGAFLFFPMGLIIQAAALGIAASSLHGRLSFGSLKLVVVVTMASAATWLILRALATARWRSLGIPPPRALAIVLLVASLALVGNVLIHSKNRWSFESSLLFPSAETYFRPPLQTDNQRHVMLVAALLRGNESPFLPGTRLTYQLQWHHLTAAFVSVFHGISLHAFVSGSILAMAFLFYFVLWWGLCCLRPRLMWKPAWAIPLGVLIFAHADLLNLAGTSLSAGVPGIEADGSAVPLLGRHFSLVGTALTAPQHLLFLLFFVGFSVVRHRQLGGRPRFDVSFLFLGFLASPILFAFFSPFFFFFERRRWKTWIALTVSGYLSFWLLSGFPPHALLRRESSPQLLGLLGPIKYWLGFPLLGIGMFGAMGVLATFLLGSGLKRRNLRWDALTLGLVGGTLATNLLTREAEIQRHWAILAALACAIFVVRRLSMTVFWKRALFAACGLAVPAHAYFLYCYLGKPSVVSPTIPWGDYFTMNRTLRERFRGEPVLSAAVPELGLYLPVTLEAATSWAGPGGPGVHSIVTSEQTRRLRKSFIDGILPYARDFGYGLATWGPAEERAWGSKGRRRFLRAEDILAVEGTVALFRLSDITAKHPARHPGRTARDHFELGEFLSSEGWNMEAIDQFEEGLRLESASARGHYGMAFTLKALGDLKSAVPHFETALAAGLPVRQKDLAESALAESKKNLSPPTPD